MQLIKVFALLCVVLFLLALVTSAVADNRNELCGLWCAGPPSEEAWQACITQCLETLP